MNPLMMVAAIAWIAHTYGMVAAYAVAVMAAATSGTLGVLGDTQSWGLILGVLTPLVVSIIQQPRWSDPVRAIIHVVAAVVVGVVTVLANGQITDQSTILTTIAVVLVASSAAYGYVWKPLGVAPKIERATSPSSGPSGG
jgi:hypothetical protein